MPRWRRSSPRSRCARAEIAAGPPHASRRPSPASSGLTDISIGDLVNNTTAITTLDDLSTVRVDFEVPERWAGPHRRGPADHRERAGAARARSSPGRITGIDNRVDETTRTLRLRGRARQPRRAAEDRHGDHRRARVRQRRGSSPCRASPCSGTGAAPSSGRSRTAPRAAPRSRSSGGRAASSSSKGDVAAGDQVVVEGLQRLREGAKVTEVDEAPTIVEDGARRRKHAGRGRSPAISGAGRPADAELTPMAKQFDDARAWLAEATQGHFGALRPPPGARRSSPTS